MGSGFKDFASGAILTAGDVDNYLMRQTVMTFASASARDTALSAVLDEGMVAYLEDTDAVTVYDGSAWNAIGGGGGGGKILQVVSTTKTDTFSASVAGGGTTSVTGLTATITPSDAANKVLVFATVTGSQATEYASMMAILTRGGTPIGVGDAAGVRTPINGGTVARLTNSADIAEATVVYLDAPASTSALTYGIDILNASGSTRTMYVNRTVQDSNVEERPRSSSTITVMEVSA